MLLELISVDLFIAHCCLCFLLKGLYVKRCQVICCKRFRGEDVAEFFDVGPVAPADVYLRL